MYPSYLYYFDNIGLKDAKGLLTQLVRVADS